MSLRFATSPRLSRSLFLLACLVGTPLSAQGKKGAPASPWKAGFAAVDITPDRPVWMSGYASRNKPSEGVAAPIHAKAMVLEDGQGTKVVVVTLDLSGVWGYFTDPIVEEVGAEVGAPRERFLFSCSHTHSGPSLSLDDEGRGAMTKQDAENTVAYTKETARKIAGAIRAADKDLQPVRLSWGVGVAPFVMNRREFTDDKGIILGHNPRGPADRSVPVMKVETAEGKLRGVIFGCAAHNTTMGGNNYRICGDYAGYAQEYIEAQHPGVQAMFMLGCAGDANPYPRTRDTSFDYVTQHGRTLGTEVCRVLETPLTPIAGPLKTARGVADLPYETKVEREKVEELTKSPQSSVAGNAKALLEKIDQKQSLGTTERCPVTMWQFGEDLTLVALSGEVVVDYVYLIEKALGPRRLWIAAYSHELPGYITSARVQAEGGYEAKGVYGKGTFAPETQDVYVRKVKELSDEVGRKLLK